MQKNYERIKRELVAKGSIIDYYHDTMKIPNGNTAVWDFVNHKGAAAVVAVKENGNVLMVRQYRNALERMTLEIPAGGLNAAETMAEAAGRELLEETGFYTKDITFLLSIRTTVAFCNEKIDIFYAKNLMLLQQKLDEDEFLEVVEYPIEELVQMIQEGSIQDSKTICALLYYYNQIVKKNNE